MNSPPRPAASATMPGDAAAAAASGAPSSPARSTAPPAKPLHFYRNEEVLLFRTPTDDSHLVLFNLPTRPFIHAFYDLKTVARMRKDADEAMRRERGETIPELTAATTGEATPSAAPNAATVAAGSAAASSSTATLPAAPTAASSAASASTRPFSSTSMSSGLTTASAALAAQLRSGAHLASSYHAAHLQNVERVLWSVVQRYGLVHEVSVQCKKRGEESASRKRKRAFFDDDDSPNDSLSPVEQYEQQFTMWAFVKYYSVLHAQVALKALNRLNLWPGARLRAKMCERNNNSSQAVASTQGSSSSSSSGAPAPRPYFPLSYHRCLDLCNYFLGFNNWSCEIRSIRRYDPLTDEEAMDESQRESTAYRAAVADRFRHSWTAHVLVCMAGQTFECRGVGHVEKREDWVRAKKIAVTNAYRQLFASLALVILHDGRVAVQLLP